MAYHRYRSKKHFSWNSVVLLRRNIPPETLEKLLLRRKIFFAMSLMTELTLALTINDPHDDA